MTTSTPLASELPPEALSVLQRAQACETWHEGRRMVWHQWGEAQGEPVVLAHGGSGSWTHWIRNVDTLAAQGRQVLVPDLPGFGDSDLPVGGTDADAVVAPLASGIAALLGQRPFDLVGFSFGGLVSGLLAATLPPANLRRLVLVGAPLMGDGVRTLRLLEWRHLKTEEERAAIHRHNLAELMLLKEASITPLALQLHATNLAHDRMRRRRLARTDALGRALFQVRVPMAAIFGAGDALYRDRMDDLVATLRSHALMKSVAVVPEAGHWVQFEAADAFDFELLRALDV